MNSNNKQELVVSIFLKLNESVALVYIGSMSLTSNIFTDQILILPLRFERVFYKCYSRVYFQHDIRIIQN